MKKLFLILLFPFYVSAYPQSLKEDIRENVIKKINEKREMLYNEKYKNSSDTTKAYLQGRRDGLMDAIEIIYLWQLNVKHSSTSSETT